MRPRPNYFLGLRINSVEVHKKIKEVQDLAVSHNPELRRALIKPCKLHITLAVTFLEKDEDVDIVKEKLSEWAKVRAPILFDPPILLTFKGINFFKGNVLFADFVRCENYSRVCSIAEELNGVLKSAGYSTDHRPFNPHLTILKLSKAPALLKDKWEINKIFESLANKNFSFGVQDFEEFDLLCMTKVEPDGYYKSLHCVKVPQPKLLDIERKKIQSEKVEIRRRFHSACLALRPSTGQVVKFATVVSLCALAAIATKKLLKS